MAAASAAAAASSSAAGRHLGGVPIITGFLPIGTRDSGGSVLRTVLPHDVGGFRATKRGYAMASIVRCANSAQRLPDIAISIAQFFFYTVMRPRAPYTNRVLPAELANLITRERRWVPASLSARCPCCRGTPGDCMLCPIVPIVVRIFYAIVMHPYATGELQLKLPAFQAHLETLVDIVFGEYVRQASKRQFKSPGGGGGGGGGEGGGGGNSYASGRALNAVAGEKLIGTKPTAAAAAAAASAAPSTPESLSDETVSLNEDSVNVGVPLGDDSEYNGPDMFTAPDDATSEDDWNFTRASVAESQAQLQLRRTLSMGASGAEASRFSARFQREMYEKAGVDRAPLQSGPAADAASSAAAAAAAGVPGVSAVSPEHVHEISGVKRHKADQPIDETDGPSDTAESVEAYLNALVSFQKPKSFFMVTPGQASGKGIHKKRAEVLLKAKRESEAKWFVRNPIFSLPQQQQQQQQPTALTRPPLSPQPNDSVLADLQRAIASHTKDPPERIKRFLDADKKSTDSAFRLRAMVDRYLYLQERAFQSTLKFTPRAVATHSFEDWIGVKDPELHQRVRFGKMVDAAPNIVYLDPTYCTERWWAMARSMIHAELLVFRDEAPVEFERIWVLTPTSSGRVHQKPAAAAAAGCGDTDT